MEIINFQMTGLSFNKSSLSWEMFIKDIRYPKDKLEYHPVEHIIHIDRNPKNEGLFHFRAFIENLMNDCVEEYKDGYFEFSLDITLLDVLESDDEAISLVTMTATGVWDGISKWQLPCSRYDIDQITSRSLIDNYQYPIHPKFKDSRVLVA